MKCLACVGDCSRLSVCLGYGQRVSCLFLDMEGFGWETGNWNLGKQEKRRGKGRGED